MLQDDRAPRRHAVPVHGQAGRALGARPGTAGRVGRADLLRRGRRGDVRGDGPARHRPPDELLRPRHVLVRRRPRALEKGSVLRREIRVTVPALPGAQDDTAEQGERRRRDAARAWWRENGVRVQNERLGERLRSVADPAWAVPTCRPQTGCPRRLTCRSLDALHAVDALGPPPGPSPPHAATRPEVRTRVVVAVWGRAATPSRP